MTAAERERRIQELTRSPVVRGIRRHAPREAIWMRYGDDGRWKTIMMTAFGGKSLLLTRDLPETVVTVLPGRRLSEVIQDPMLNGDLIIVAAAGKQTGGRTSEFAMIRFDHDCKVDGWMDHVMPGMTHDPNED